MVVYAISLECLIFNITLLFHQLLSNYLLCRIVWIFMIKQINLNLELVNWKMY